MVKNLLMLVALGCLCLIPYAVFADDLGVVVDVTVIGDGTDAYVNMIGDNNDLWVDGVPYQQSLNRVLNGAIQGATPNSLYSGISTGMLPPLGLIPEVNAIAPGKYTQPYVGWMGYFCPTSNTNPYVYKGAGCGGAWGVADGYPDLWGRRQIAGIAVDFTIQREKLLQAQTALVKVIGELKSKGDSIESLNTKLNTSLDTLSGIVTDLSVMEEENLQFREQTTKQINDLYNVLIFLIVFVIIVVLAAIAGFAILSKLRKPY